MAKKFIAYLIEINISIIVRAFFGYKTVLIILWGIVGVLFSSCAEGQDRSASTYTSPNPQSLARFGAAVAGVGDINEDGVSDILVGARGENIGEVVGAGRAYIFSGKTGKVVHTLASPNNGGEFGHSVAEVEDIDGDGVSDLLIGAPYENPGGIDQAGRVYLYSGDTGELLKAFTSLQAEEQGHFGCSVAGVGDTNGDGAPDFLVGAKGESPYGEDSAGQAYLLSGSTGDVIRRYTFPKEGPIPALEVYDEKHSRFGSEVAEVGDVNGDGASDFLISAYEKGVGEKDEAGQVALFSGADGEPIRTLASPNVSEEGHFGWSVEGVGDIDKDGTPDLLIGSIESANGKNEAGRAYLFSGSTGNVIRTFTSPNSQRNGSFGTALTGTGDVNGDGTPDLLIGAPGEEILEGKGAGRETYKQTGQAYLFSGDTGEIIQVFSPLKEDGVGTFGRAVSSVTTSRGTAPAVLIGAPLEKDGKENIGRVYRFSVDSMSK